MVTVNYPKNAKISTFLEPGSVFEEQMRLLDKIEQNASYLRETLESEYPGVTDPYDIDRSMIRRAAWLEAYNYVNDNLLDWVTNFIKQAIIETEEYNYDQYVYHLMRAVRRNIEDIVSFTSDYYAQSTDFHINFNILGGPDEWASAVKKTREILGTKSSSPELRSKMWREKVFGVGREGVTITKEYKGRGKKKKGAGKKDITEKYAQLYANTIELRLSFLGMDKAPFWYLIDKGNVSTKLGSDIGGEAYPLVAPTHFADRLEGYLENQFNRALERFIEDVQNFVDRKEAEHKNNLRVTEERSIQFPDEDNEWLFRAYEDLVDSSKTYHSVYHEGEEILFTGTSKTITKEETFIPEMDQALIVHHRVSSKGKPFYQFYDPIKKRWSKGRP